MPEGLRRTERATEYGEGPLGTDELKRRGGHERKPERMRLSKVRAELEPFTAELAYWALSVSDELTGAEPEMPDALNDRAQDGCEVLTAIADLAGGEWAERAVKAFVTVMGGEEESDYGVVLLGHIQQAFDALGLTRPVRRWTA